MVIFVYRIKTERIGHGKTASKLYASARFVKSCCFSFAYILIVIRFLFTNIFAMQMHETANQSKKLKTNKQQCKVLLYENKLKPSSVNKFLFNSILHVFFITQSKTITNQN